jgi:hypothetical protein
MAVVRIGVVLAAAWLAGCGGGGSGGSSGTTGGAQPLPPPVVAVVPAQVTVTKGRAVTLSAVVVGAGPEVAWTVEGGPADGSVDGQGTYTAPAVVPDHPVIVRATSAADARGTATAVVRVIVGDNLKVGSNRSVSPTGVTVSTFSGGQRSVAVHGSTVYMVWNDKSRGDDDVYLAVSCDRGATVGPPILVNGDAGTAPQRTPTVAVDGAGRAIIAWIDGRNHPLTPPAPQAYDVYLAAATAPDCRSVDVGPNLMVASVGMSGDPSVALAVDWFGRLYLAWPDDGRGSTTATIWIARGTPTADTSMVFTQPVRVSNATTYQSRPAVAADDSGNVVIAWNDSRSGSQDVYWRKGRFAANGTVQFPASEEVMVNKATTGDQISPSVALDRKGIAYVAWGQQLGSLEQRHIYLASSVAPDDLVVRANLPVVPDSLDADENFPSLVVDADGGITIAFGDNRTCLANNQGGCLIAKDGTGQTDIYLLRSVDGGQNFHPVPHLKVNDDDLPQQHGRPSVAVDDVGRAYTVWTDDRNGSSQPFMARAE